jgi:hypothetical protein
MDHCSTYNEVIHIGNVSPGRRLKEDNVVNVSLFFSRQSIELGQRLQAKFLSQHWIHTTIA